MSSNVGEKRNVHGEAFDPWRASACNQMSNWKYLTLLCEHASIRVCHRLAVEYLRLKVDIGEDVAILPQASLVARQGGRAQRV